VVWACYALARLRWRQVNTEDPNAIPDRLQLEVSQLKAAKICYLCSAIMDRHNRCGQDDLMPEKKLGTMDWSKRVNMSVGQT
jgi:hypothetical protein